ncbi:DUF6572 domain-containing protein [Luteolibacter soli]|uniref:DUF6572 domain-containing protein n=1 Tax=Luteolibacter soli TaxID=3135280 RepID=A0ABU9AZD1_9BACT
MPLDEPETIDAIHIDPATGACVLTIRDEWDWSDRRTHLEALLNKVCFYLDSIEAGKVVVRMPLSIGREHVIEIEALHPLPEFDGDFMGELEASCAFCEVKVRYRPGGRPAEVGGSPTVA